MASRSCSVHFPRLVALSLSLVLAACGAARPVVAPPARPFDVAARQSEAQRIADAAVAASDRGDLEGAIRELDRALALDPDNLVIAYEKAFALYRVRRFAEAARLLETLGARPDSTDQVFQLLGNCYDGLEQRERAVAAYRRGLARFPTSGRLHYDLGIVLGAQAGVEAAIATWQAGILVDPGYPTNYFAVAMTLADRDPLSAALHAEAFMNLERGSERTRAASQVLRQSYAHLLKAAQAQEIHLGDVRPLTVGLGVLVAAIAPSLPGEASASTETLVALHARLLAGWQEELAERAPSTVHAWEAQVAQAGHLEAYERWLLGAGDDFPAWCEGHDDACSAFVTWFDAHETRLPAGTLPVGAALDLSASGGL
jgi:tetratricopeptide (TPR) repeat protein